MATILEKLDLGIQPRVLLAGIAAVALLAMVLQKLSSQKKSYPPSPPGALPVLGHTLTMAASKYPWRTFQLVLPRCRIALKLILV